MLERERERVCDREREIEEERVCVREIEREQASEREVVRRSGSDELCHVRLYRGTSLIRKCPLPQDHPRALGIFLQ